MGERPKSLHPTVVDNNNVVEVEAAIEAEKEGAKDTGGRPAGWQDGGCQSIVFFHVPKTGGESLNDLWQVEADAQGKMRDTRVSGWKGYEKIALRNTELTPGQQSRFLQNM